MFRFIVDEVRREIGPFHSRRSQDHELRIIVDRSHDALVLKYYSGPVSPPLFAPEFLQL